MIFHNVLIEVVKSNKISALDVILKENLSYYRINKSKNGCILLLIPYKLLKKYRIAFDKYGIEYIVRKESGILSVFHKNRARIGLLLGALVLILGVYFSSKIVWRVEIDGNSRLSDAEVLSILEKSGFGIGSYIPRIDYDQVHNEILINCDDISWVSLNINGNVARVEIKETLHGKEVIDESYSNIVASTDGQILDIKVSDGKKVVNTHSTVKKGDLLISGVVDSQSEGVRYCRAEGEVLAYVNKTIQIEIPRKETKKIYTGKAYTQKKVKIFSKAINFSLNYNNYYKNCDKIENKEYAMLFSKISLPIELQTIRYYEYEFKEVTYSNDDMVNMAFSQLENELKTLNIVTKNVETSYSDGILSLVCQLTCIENIAQEVKINIK